MFRPDFSLKSELASRQTVAATHVGFVLSGVVTTLLGPLLPALAVRWSLNDIQAGYLFTAQSIGTLAGVSVGGPITRRIGWLRGLGIGFVLMSSGLAALGVSSWFWGLTAVSLNGIALGIVLPATNLLVAGVNPARRAESLNILNLLWGFGAVLGPVIVVPLTRAGGIRTPLMLLAFLSAATAIWLVRLPVIRVAEVSEQHGKSERFTSKTFRTWFVLLVALLGFLYVGSENAVGGWIALYSIRLIRSLGASGAWTPSIFWAALLAGRAAVPVALRFMTPEKLVLAGLLLAASGLSLLVTAHSAPALLAGIVLTGFGFGPVFPTSIASATHHLGTGASRAVNLFFAMGTLGSATLPWTVGFLSTRYGNLRTGLAAALLAGVALIALQLGIMLLLTRYRTARFSNHVVEQRGV